MAALHTAQPDEHQAAPPTAPQMGQPPVNQTAQSPVLPTGQPAASQAVVSAFRPALSAALQAD